MVLISKIRKFICLGIGFRVWGIGIILAFGCSNNYERDNPTDPIHVYSVSFNLGEAIGLTPPAAMTGNYGDTIQLPDGSGLENNGFIIDHWRADSVVKWKGITDVKDINYAVGADFTITGNITMEAVWVRAYTVTFDRNEATGGTVPEAIKSALYYAKDLPGQGNLERTGYVFCGWNTDSSGAGTNYGPGSLYTVPGNITLYATWCSGTDYYCDTRDWQVYKVTTIGTQVWFAENLNYNAGSSSTCYNNSESNCDKYGRLYKWNYSHSGCPEGWHVPSTAEWNTLINYVGGSSTAGKYLKATSGWNSNGNGTDQYGFSALPGGYRSNLTGRFNSVGDVGYWWSADAVNSNAYRAYYRFIGYGEDVGSSSEYTDEMYSVRCLRDAPSSYVSGSSSSVLNQSSSSYVSGSSSSVLNQSSSSSVVSCADFDEVEEIVHYGKMKKQLCDERDGKRYVYVPIGEQIWMAENLNYNADGSKCNGDANGGDSQGNCVKYGRLYDWNTAMNNSASSTTVPSGVRGVCPEGWHLPSNEELAALLSYVNNDATKLKATSGWGDYNGTDDYGFSALPGGRYGVAGFGSWWSASEYSSVYTYCGNLYSDDDYVNWSYSVKTALLSVRCVKD